MPITTSDNDIKERLSVAYVTTIAARAGCQVLKLDIDKESIDATIRPISGSKAMIDLQLKATSTDIAHGDYIKYSLPIKNYDDLRDTLSINPHYLVIFCLRADDQKWVRVNHRVLVLGGSAYYGSLYGHPAVPNSTSKTVSVPKGQLFDADILRRMIDSAPDRMGILREQKNA